MDWNLKLDWILKLNNLKIATAIEKKSRRRIMLTVRKFFMMILDFYLKYQLLMALQAISIESETIFGLFLLWVLMPNKEVKYLEWTPEVKFALVTENHSIYLTSLFHINGEIKER